MTEFYIDTNFLVGTSGGGKWSGRFVSPEESKKTQQLGQIFVIINLSAPGEFNVKMAGDLLLDNIQDVYYDEAKDSNPIHRLEKAFMSTAKRLEYLLEREKLVAQEGIDLNIAAVVVRKGFIYMAVLGEGSIMLWRNASLIELTSALKDLTGRNLIRSGSGRICKEDVFVLLSASALLEISEDEIRSSIKNLDLSRIEKKSKDPLFSVLMLKALEREKGEVKQKEAAPLLGETQDNLEEEEKDLDEEEFEDESKTLSRYDDKKEGEIEEDNEDLLGSFGGDGTKASSARGDLKDRTKDGGTNEEREREKLDGVKHKGLKDIGEKIKGKLADKKTYQVILIKLREFVYKLYKLAKEYIWDGLMGMGRKGLYLKGSAPKTSVRGIIILIIIVVSSLYISIRAIQKHQDKVARVKEVEAILEEVVSNFDNGRDLGEAGDIAESVSIIESAISKLEGAKDYNVQEEEIEAKISEGMEILDEVRKVIVVTKDNIITDVAGYIEGAGANDIMLKGGKLYIADTQTSAIYEVGFDGGEVKKITSDDTPLSRPDAIAFDSEGNMLISDLESGILKFNLTEKKVEALAGLSVSSVGAITEIENYAIQDGSNFLYILRGDNNDVRKISKYASGYSLPSLRMADSRFAGAHDIEIDGKIYVLTQSDGIFRYYVDTPDPYTIVGLDKPITSSNCLELDFKLVYVGDSTLKRIVVITKGSYLAPQQGRYVAQFLYRGDGDSFSDIREIVVDNDLRLMFVLAGTKVFKVELNQVDQYAEKFE